MEDADTVLATFRLPGHNTILSEIRELAGRVQTLEDNQRKTHDLLVSIHALLTSQGGDVRITVEPDSRSTAPPPSRDTSSATIVHDSSVANREAPRKRRRTSKSINPIGLSFSDHTTSAVPFTTSTKDHSPTLAMELDQSIPTHSPRIASLSPAGDGVTLAGFSFRNSAAQIAALRKSQDNNVQSNVLQNLQDKDLYADNLFVRQNSETSDSEDEVPPQAPGVAPKKSISASSFFESPMDPPDRPPWGTETRAAKKPNKGKARQSNTTSDDDHQPDEKHSAPPRRFTVGLPVSSQSSPHRQTDTRTRYNRAIVRPSQPGMTGWSDVDPRLLNQRQKK